MMRKTACKILNLRTAAFKLLPLLLLLTLQIHESPTMPEKPSSFPGDAEQVESLQTDADRLLSLFDEMPPVEVFLVDQPVLESGSSIETGVAFTRCDSPEKPIIFIKKAFYAKTNRKQLVNILKHELTHAWACRQNLMSGHDELFRRKFTAVGGFGN